MSSSEPTGFAKAIEGDATPRTPQITLEGDCLRETLMRLERGWGGARPVPCASLEIVLQQAAGFVAKIVDSYESGVAAGEVGVGGTAEATTAAPSSGSCPTGLLYGRIQSGKTLGMIITSALALDNGFRVVVVLTTNFVKLVEQTAQRFRVLDGPLVYSSREGSAGEYEWDKDKENILQNTRRHGLVVICAKDPKHQRSLLTFLRESARADGYPCLILDDEADQATPDTTAAARAQQRSSAPSHGSTTFRLTVENDAVNELGQSLRESLRHNVFLQVTATPYALLLQDSDSPLRPKFSHMLEPGSGYRGGEDFFEASVVQTGAPPICFVDAGEGTVLRSGALDAPEGLARAIAFFLLASTTHSQLAGPVDATGYKLLCHTSPKTAEHDSVGRLIRRYVDQTSARLDDTGDLPAEFAWAHQQLRVTCPEAPDLAALTDRLKRRLHQRKVLIVNSRGDTLDFGPEYNFVVGGNILGRGLTIENLLVTYYLREAKTTQMDTMLQHARMYGYRSQLMPFTRVFLPMSLAARFHRIHTAEEALRELLAERERSDAPVPVEVAQTLRATRPGILNLGCISAFRPGQQVYPTQPAFTPERLGTSTERLDALIAELLGGSITYGSDSSSVDLTRVRELIRTVRVEDEDTDDWEVEAIDGVLASIGGRYGNKGRISVRQMKRKGPLLPTGSISSAEHQQARASGVPFLFMMREMGAAERNWAGRPFWHPTLVFPQNMPAQVFNIA